MRTEQAGELEKPGGGALGEASGQGQVEPTRVCEWCAKPIPRKALKCPRCNEWRKDIKTVRSRAWQCLLYCLALIASMVFWFIVANRQRWWVEAKAAYKGIPLIVASTYRLSLDKFLGHWSGWVMILLAGGCAFILCIGVSYEHELKRKTGRGLL